MDVRKYRYPAGKFPVKKAGALLLTLAAALGLWLFIAANYRRAATAEISRSLITINFYKTAQIKAWLEDRGREAERLTRHPLLGGVAAEEISKPGSRRALLDAWLKNDSAQKRYASMAFLSPKGAVIAATPGYAARTENYLKEFFALALRKGTPLLTDLYLAADGRPRLTMISPISAGAAPGGKILCLLVVNIDPETEFYPLVKAAPLLFATAETVLVRKEGENVLFLTNLDYSKGSALKLTHPLSDTRLPAAKALKEGYSGFYEGVDYRGRKVFSAVNRVGGSDWVVLTKVERDAILAPVRTRERLALALLLLTAGLAFALVYFLLRARERAGLAAERRLAALFADLPGVAYRCANDRNWTMQFLSEGCLDLTGYQPVDLLANKTLSFNDLIVPEDRERVWETIQAAVSKNEKYELAYSLKCRDGGVKYLFEQGRAIKRPDGTVEALEGFLADITPLRKAEAGLARAEGTLRDSEERLRVTLEETRIGTWDWDVAADTWQASDTYSTMLGYPPENGPDPRKVWLERVHPDDRAMIAEKIRAVLSGSAAKYQYEARIKHADGAYRWVAVLGTTVKKDGDGKPARIIGVRLDITDSKRTKDALLESENKYRTLIDASVDGILTADLETRKFRFANRAICRMLGYTAEELTRLSVEDIHPKDALPAVIAEFEAQARGEKTLAAGLPCLRKDGTVFYADINTTRTTIDGRDCNLGLFRDITERRKAEEAVRESEERYRSLFENMLNGFAYCRMIFEGENPADFVYLSVNKSFETLTGLKDVAGKKVSEVIPGIREADPVLFERYGRVARGGKPETFETWVEALKMWFSISVYSPAQDHFVAVFDVITARKQAEEALRTSEAHLRAALESTADGILAVDNDGKVLQANRRFAELWRIPRPLLESGDDKALLDFVLEQLEEPDAFLAKVRQLYHSDAEATDTLAFRDGRIFERFSLPMTQGGTRIGRVWSFRDITARRLAQLELESLNRDLADREKEMENFLYITTHDLRSPLINIQGFGQNLERYMKELLHGLASARLPEPLNAALSKLTAERIPEALNFILESSNKMDSLINSLLKVARLGRVQMKPQPVEMNDLVKRLTNTMRFQLEEAGAEFRAGTLPPCKADPGAVSQILSNLLVNAIKYRAAGRALKISVTGEVRGARAFYRIADNGAGIAGKDLHRIWDLFYRAGAADGEGIGLTVVKYMAEKNGGAVRAESEEGRGSAFYLELPAAGGKK